MATILTAGLIISPARNLHIQTLFLFTLLTLIKKQC